MFHSSFAGWGTWDLDSYVVRPPNSTTIRGGGHPRPGYRDAVDYIALTGRIRAGIGWDMVDWRADTEFSTFPERWRPTGADQEQRQPLRCVDQKRHAGYTGKSTMVSQGWKPGSFKLGRLAVHLVKVRGEAQSATADRHHQIKCYAPPQEGYL